MNIFVLDRFIFWGPRFGPGTIGNEDLEVTKNSALGRILLCSPIAFHVPSRNTVFNGSCSESLWLVKWEIHRCFCLELGFPAAQSLEPTGMRDAARRVAAQNVVHNNAGSPGSTRSINHIHQ